MNKLDALATRLAGEASPSVIRAYHGSPYDFDRFDASKIATGEGNQVYGHGLYFAGDEDVARSYRDALKTSVDRSVPRDLQTAYIEASIARGDFANRRGGWLRKNPRMEFPQQAEMDANETLFYDLQNRVHAAANNPGRMYEVEIAHPEDSLLDYDSPFGKTSGVVAAEVLASKSPGIIPDQTLRAIQDGTWASRDFTYGDSPLLANRRLQKFSKMPEGAAALLDAGIPGIRYLDGMSRSAGDGTRNYVMFPGTEDSIRILRKYAFPGAVGTGVASQYGEE